MTQPLPDANRAIVHAAADRIRANVDAYDQATFWGDAWCSKSAFLHDIADPECETPACLAGHITAAAALAGVLPQLDKGGDVHFSRTAGSIIGTSPWTLPSEVFGGSAYAWPEPHRSRWYDAKDSRDPTGQAKAAADLLDDLADGVVYWNGEAWVQA